MFVTSIRFNFSLIFVGKAEPIEVELVMVLHSNGRLLALPTNIGQLEQDMEVKNTLAYYDTAAITAVKGFIEGPLGRILNSLFSL